MSKAAPAPIVQNPVYVVGQSYQKVRFIRKQTPEEATESQRAYVDYRVQVLASWFAKHGIKFDGDADAAFTEYKRRNPSAFNDTGDTLAII